MATCRECAYYDEIDDDKGKCKKTKAERHIATREDHDISIINGWPTVNGDETACAEKE